MRRYNASLFRLAASALVGLSFTWSLAAQAWHIRPGGGARTFVVPAHPPGAGSLRTFNGGPTVHPTAGGAPSPVPPHPSPSPHPSQPGPHPGPPPPAPHPPGYGPPPEPPPHPPAPPPPHSDDWYHPWATAAVIGATTATAIAIGTAVASVPKSCIPVIVNGVSYQQCGSTWYQPQYVEATLQYVVVASPR